MDRRQFFKTLLEVPTEEQNELPVAMPTEMNFSEEEVGVLLGVDPDGFAENTLNRRDFLIHMGAVGAVGMARLAGVNMEVSRDVESSPKFGIDSDSTAEEIESVTNNQLKELGFEFEEVQSLDGESKMMMVPKGKYLDILDLDLDGLNEDEKQNAIYEQVAALSTAVEEDTAEKSLVSDQVMDIVGSIIAGWGVINGFRKGGITRDDYLRIGIFTGIAYAVGDENRRTQLEHNLIETKDAVISIGSLTEASDMILMQKGNLVRDFVKEVGGDPGVSQGELEAFLYDLFQDDPDKERELVAKIEQFEGETLQNILDGMGKSDIDIAQLAADLGADKINGGLTRVDALRTLTILASTLGPVFSTLISTSLLSPLARSIARDENGNWDDGIMSTLQGYVPNNLGLSGLGFIPGYYKSLDGIFGGIPVIKDAILGADFGPRFGIKQKAGEHGLEAIEKLDQVNIYSQLFMAGGFTFEMLSQIARVEGREISDVLKEFISPTEISGSVELLSRYNLTPNIKDAFFGRLQRSADLIYSALSMSDQPTGHHNEQRHDNKINTFFDKIKQSFINAANTVPGGRTASEKINAARGAILGVTNSHSWEHAIGHELTDIFKTLPFQSLSVPYVEGLMTMVVNNMEKLIPDDTDLFIRDQIVDFINVSAFGAMSTSFDNFAAVKAALTTSFSRLKQQMESGIVHQEDDLNMRTTAIVKKMYDSAVIFGGGLPMGNMPNFKMFPMNIYGLSQALKRLPVRSIPGVLSYAGVSVAEYLGTLPGMPVEWFIHEGQAAH